MVFCFSLLNGQKAQAKAQDYNLRFGFLLALCFIASSSSISAI